MSRHETLSRGPNAVPAVVREVSATTHAGPTVVPRVGIRNVRTDGAALRDAVQKDHEQRDDVQRDAVPKDRAPVRKVLPSRDAAPVDGTVNPLRVKPAVITAKAAVTVAPKVRTRGKVKAGLPANVDAVVGLLDLT